MYSRFYKLILILFSCSVLSAQDCSITVKGQVSDTHTEHSLSYVNIFVQENADGVSTNDEGFFELNDLCPGHYHLIFSHIGCESIKIHLDLERDTFININLSHSESLINTVLIEGQRDEHDHQASHVVHREHIEDQANKNISDLLENETGVALIKNGTGISKPVVHGLYGNRLLILNNGIPQAGQQWGNDHSPEIDPFSADRISIIKGVNAINFAGGNLGSMVLIEPKPIEKEPHLHGQLNYIFESNGRGHSVNSRIGKYSKALAWRLSTTFKRYGDRSTPDYFLNNTGNQEINASLQLEKSWNDKLFVKLYASTFNTTIGVLRGSHVGNLDDLQLAFNRDIPFYTEETFSYALEAPKQDVNHHFLKLSSKYFISDQEILEFTLATQINNRSEFDIRRQNFADKPSLSLFQTTVNSELKYSKTFLNSWQLRIGVQQVFTDNTNNPETNIFPLVPDYRSWKNGFFTTMSKQFDKLYFSSGLRYDYEYQNVLKIENKLPPEIREFNNHFHNISGLVSLKYDITGSQSFRINSGYTMRNPGVNELYSQGLHQGVSGIEEGDENLELERAIKNTLEYQWTPDPSFSINTLLYSQLINDYIFLDPTGEIRPTIRGAFPVFRYAQTNAHIMGLDFSCQFTVRNVLNGQLKYSYIKGQDTKNDMPLVFIPANRIYSNVAYRPKVNVDLFDSFVLEDLEFELNAKYVFDQDNILPEQDFVPPPEAYFLMGMKFSADVVFPLTKLGFFVNVDNLFSLEYRDYLNRQRYFADELGRSITLGLNLKF